MSAGIAALVAQLAELTDVLRPVAEQLAAAALPAAPAAAPPVALAGQPGDQPVDERAVTVAGLRELVEFLEAHPDVPFGPYDGRVMIAVSNLPHMRGRDEAEMLAEVARVAGALGVEADLRDERHAPHPHATKTFRGGVQYAATYITKAYRRGYKPAETLLGVEEVAGSVGMGPATAPPARPVVLVASPITGGPPARAEVVEDNGGTVVKVIYCDSRTSARVARRRILGRETGGAYTGPTATDVLAPAADAEPEHRQIGGSAGPMFDDNSAECACGALVAGFDTHAEAVAALARHIANPEPEPEG